MDDKTKAIRLDWAAGISLDDAVATYWRNRKAVLSARGWLVK